VQIRERKHNVTEQAFVRWRNKYGGMKVSGVRRLKSENGKLKRLVTELLLALDGLKWIPVNVDIAESLIPVVRYPG
jgi:hypothetical protein